jgi:hypothetical protein
MPDDSASSVTPFVERRKNLRLRKLIDDLQVGVRENREAIDRLTAHVSGLLHDVDALKRERTLR